jgi:hypothetical protein
MRHTGSDWGSGHRSLWCESQVSGRSREPSRDQGGKKGRGHCSVKMSQSDSMGILHTSYSKRVSSVRSLCLRSVKVRTCHEFEWLGDKATKFLGVWHLNVGHLCGMVGFELWV